MTKAREIAELGQKLTVDASGNLEFAGDLELGDNNKALFGAGSDLQIYHNGIDSYINDVGTGRLYIRGNDSVRIQATAGSENMGVFNQNGSVDLYYDNSKKLATTSTGIDVTGSVTADGLTVESGNPTILNTTGADDSIISTLYFSNTQGGSSGNHAAIRGIRTTAAAGALELHTKDGGGLKKRMNIANTGDISFYEDTGTNVRMKWFAAEESLEIGAIQTGTNAPLSVKTNGSNHAISIEENNGAETWQIGVNVDGNLGFYNSGAAITPTVAFVDNGSAVFNDGSLDADFRVESDNNTHMLFVDGGNDSVNIKSSANTGYSLNIEGGIQMGLVNDVPDSNGYSFIGATDGGTGGIRSGEGNHIIIAARSTAPRDIIMTTRDNGGISRQRLTIYGNDEQLVVNEDSRDYDFRVESNNNSHMLFVDGGADRVRIGSSTISSAALGVVSNQDNTADFWLDGSSTLHIQNALRLLQGIPH